MTRSTLWIIFVGVMLVSVMTAQQVGQNKALGASDAPTFTVSGLW